MIKNPFIFLDSFEKEDKLRFFGRKKETGQLYNALHVSKLVLLYGASGTGKTSLVKCGLANQFHDSDWLPIFIRRGQNLNDSLPRVLKTLLNRAETATITETDAFQLIQEIYLEHYRPIYLIFDQFEELYIMGGKVEQDRFHQTIAHLLSRNAPCKILLIIREEYIAYLSEFEKIIPILFDNRLRIEKMNDQNLGRVIHGTIQYGGIQLLEPAKTIKMILNNLRNNREGIDLTNLQVYMDRLFRKDMERQQPNISEQITFDPALVKRVGLMQNVLSEFLSEQLVEVEKGLKQKGIPNPEGLPLEILFTLVTEDGTKRNMELEDIIEALPPNRKIDEVHIAYCLEEFKRIKILRQFAKEAN